MRRRTIAILVAVALPVAVIAYLALISSIAGVLTISTDKLVYQQGETVIFTVRNNGLRAIEFPTPGLGFRIINSDTGQDVRLGWLSPQFIYNLQPLDSDTIRWEQTEEAPREGKRFDRQQVQPGNYVASVHTAGGFEPRLVTEVKFRIS